MPRSPVAVSLASLFATLAFFFEYLPRLRWVHIPYDLATYHYSLADYAFQSLKHFRWPQWDSSMYSGMSFAANVQAALYYPGTWLMFLASWSHDTLRYSALEMQVLVHVALAYVLCLYWLRGKSLQPLACILGAAVYAFSGYLCTQLQHFGLVVAFAWMPLGLRAIDEAQEQNSWRPLWKLAAASALAFLGGYPPIWLIFAFVAGVYALAGPRRWRSSTGVLLALLFSLAICAVQILPAWEATQFREPERQYGAGITDPAFFISYLVPNYYDFGLNVPVEANPFKDYMYLGAPGILGILLLFRRGGLRGATQALAVLVASLVMVTNPFALVWEVIRHSSLLADLCRSGYFLAGVAVALTELAARGLDKFLVAHVPTRAASRLFSTLRAASTVLLLMILWALYELLRWPAANFVHGPAAIFDPLITLAIFSLGLYVFRAQRALVRTLIGVALVLSVGIDYKVFGTSKRFNAGTDARPQYSANAYVQMHPEAFGELRSHPEQRVLLHELAPAALEIRHAGFPTPQGFDPFLSTQYRELITQHGTWTTNREFLMDPFDAATMHLFGIRYVITAEEGSKYQQLLTSPQFRAFNWTGNYYRVFEYLDPRPPYSLEGGTIRATTWEPEHRAFAVETTSPTRLNLSEQFYPGWTATVDGSNVAIEKWETAFQSIPVPPGQHTVEFHYRERLLPAGAAISLVSLAGLCVWIRRRVQST